MHPFDVLVRGGRKPPLLLLNPEATMNQLEIEQLVLDAYDGIDQPAPSLTEVFDFGGETYVSLNNVNGLLATFRVVGAGVEELSEEEIAQIL